MFYDFCDLPTAVWKLQNNKKPLEELRDKKITKIVSYYFIVPYRKDKNFVFYNFCSLPTAVGESQNNKITVKRIAK